MPKPKLTHAIVCDDIRQEVGNKLSFIGTYGLKPDIFVSKIPAVLPKLCFGLTFKNLRGGLSFSMVIYDPNGKEIHKMNKGLVPQEAGKTFSTIFGIFSPMRFQEEGTYKLVVTFDDEKKTNEETTLTIRRTDKPDS